MKIVYVTMEWPCRSETFAARDIRALAAYGHDVRVVALRPAGAAAARLRDDLRVDHIACDYPRLSFYPFYLLRAFAAPRLLIRLLTATLRERGVEKIKTAFLIPLYFHARHVIERENPDMVHLFWGHYPAGVGVILGAQARPRPFTMFLGAYDLVKNLRLSQIAGQYAARIFTHSHSNREIIAGRGFEADKVRVVHRGIDLAEMQTFRPASLNKTGRTICFVGRLIASKGADLLLSALPSLLASYPDVTIHIIGDGPERRHLEDLCTDKAFGAHVHFHGFLAPSSVYPILYRADILVLPSLSDSERLPNVVKEAMFAGAVPVVTASPGIEELVQDGKTGVILRTPSPEAISSAIVSLLSHPVRLSHMADHAREFIDAHFDVHQNMRLYEQEWLDILTPPAGDQSP